MDQWDRNAKKGAILLKIPHIRANSNLTIQMLYGNRQKNDVGNAFGMNWWRSRLRGRMWWRLSTTPKASVN